MLDLNDRAICMRIIYIIIRYIIPSAFVCRSIVYSLLEYLVYVRAYMYCLIEMFKFRGCIILFRNAAYIMFMMQTQLENILVVLKIK